MAATASDFATSAQSVPDAGREAQLWRANSEAQAFVKEVMEREMAAGQDNFVYLNLLSILENGDRSAA